jgi:alpha-beta hydrolase superfamily lysophospholipase
MIHDHASAIRGHDLQSASRRRCGTLRRRLDIRHNPGRHKSILAATKLSFAIGLAPRKQKLIRNPMMPCCRRHQPRTRETFLDDPQLLGIRPAPSPTSIYNVKATHLTTISKDIHTDSQLQTGKNRKAAVLGRVLSTDQLTIPTIILIGELDDWTPAKDCERWMERRAGKGAPVKLVIYPGAYHAFNVAAFRDGMRSYGHWVKYDADAALRSVLEVHDFLATELAK